MIPDENLEDICTENLNDDLFEHLSGNLIIIGLKLKKEEMFKVLSRKQRSCSC
jgi:hypothetical protein